MFLLQNCNELTVFSTRLAEFVVITQINYPFQLLPPRSPTRQLLECVSWRLLEQSKSLLLGFGRLGHALVLNMKIRHLLLLLPLAPLFAALLITRVHHHQIINILVHIKLLLVIHVLILLKLVLGFGHLLVVDDADDFLVLPLGRVPSILHKGARNICRFQDIAGN